MRAQDDSLSVGVECVGTSAMDETSLCNPDRSKQTSERSVIASLRNAPPHKYSGLTYPETLSSILHHRYRYLSAVEIIQDFDNNNIPITEHSSVFGYLVEVATRSSCSDALSRIKEELLSETSKHLKRCEIFFPNEDRTLQTVLFKSDEGDNVEESAQGAREKLPLAMTQILDAENPSLNATLREARHKFLTQTLRVVVEDEGLDRAGCATHTGEPIQSCKYCMCQPFTPSLTTYGCLIRASGRDGDITMVTWLWNHMNLYATHAPDSTSYGCLLDALVQANEVFRALKIFRYMEGDYSSQVTDAVNADDITGDLELFPKLSNDLTLLPERHSKSAIDATNKQSRRPPLIKPNTIMYSTLIKGFAQLKLSNWALALHEEMTDRGIPVNTVTFNSLVNACARRGAMKEASNILDQMMKLGIQPDLVTFSTVVKGYCIKGEVERAFRLMVLLKEKGGIQPDSILYNTLLDGCVRFRKLSLCEQVWQFMQAQDGIKPSNFTLTIFIKLYGKLGQMDKVFEILEEFPRKYKFSLNAHVYTCVISACINNKLHHLITPMFQKLLNSSHLASEPTQHDSSGNKGLSMCPARFRGGGCSPDLKSYETALTGLYKGKLYSEGIDLLALFFGLPTLILQPPQAPTANLHLRTKRLGKKHIMMWMEVLSRKRDTPIYRADVEKHLKQMFA